MPLSEKERKEDVLSRRRTVSRFTNGEAHVSSQRESFYVSVQVTSKILSRTFELLHFVLFVDTPRIERMSLLFIEIFLI